MHDAKTLTLRLHRESDHLWAEVEEMPGVYATGVDLEELREALEEAISLYKSTDEQPVAVHLSMQPPKEMTRMPVTAELVPC